MARSRATSSSLEVNIQIEAPAEALDDGDTPAEPVRDPAPARLLALEAEERSHVNAQDGAAEGVVPGEEVARAEPPAFAGERNQPLKGTVTTAHARKPVGQDATGEEVTEFLFYEVWQAGPVGAMCGLAEEDLEVLANDRVENAPLRRARLVGSVSPASNM